ncbi:MAG: alpha-glucosidase [Bacilli bacterium]|jgi:oligo-1,6-glucosidase|nr:alpha-glucosidase [Bacilli bacterium]
MKEKRFFEQQAVYQIYPRSFKDSNGDGIGDLNGIISKLDYLKDLGIGIIWLSPIYPSPNFDYGYDISDYKAINPEFGTMEDFERLLKEAKERNIRIVMDLVVNHTSIEHRWFQASLDSSSPYHDYYIWRKGKNENKLPPNNWTSNFLGSAWTYVKEADSWYLHLFTPQQPDLNWQNPKVLEEVESILRFWLDKGVYGFRCDVINEIYKSSLEDGKDSFPHMMVGKEYYLNQEGGFQILRKLHEDVFSHYDSMTVGETGFITYEDQKKYTNSALDMVFSFDHVNPRFYKLFPTFQIKYKPEFMKKTIRGWQENCTWNTVFFENHDQGRSIAKFGDTGQYYKESAKMLSTLICSLRGTPFIYQGEEIGMEDYPRMDWSVNKDIVPVMIKKMILSFHMPKSQAEKMAFIYDRDNARMPFQWDDSLSAGFSSSSKTWLPVNENYLRINAKLNEEDPTSILQFYKEGLKVRKEHPSLQTGSISFLESKKDVMAYIREEEGEKILALINLSKKERKTGIGLKGTVILSNYPDDNGEKSFTSLRPFESVLIKL